MKKYLLNSFYSLFFLLFLNPVWAQNSFNGKKISCEFMQREIPIKKGDALSNVLKIVNSSSEDSKEVFLQISHPGSWKNFTNGRPYILEPEDTMYVPVRLLPINLNEGNTRYYINVFLLDEDGAHLSFDYFFAETEKISKWTLSVYPSNRFYFLNGERELPFSINLLNEGNDIQELMLDMTDLRHDLLLSDTTGKTLKGRSIPMELQPGADTTIIFNASYLMGTRNFRWTDYENHIPKTNEDEKLFFVYANAFDPDAATIRKPGRKTGKKIGLHKLSNVKKVNPSGSSTLPLILDFNVNNLLSKQASPFANLFLRGNTTLDNGAYLNYFTQVDFTSNFFNEEIWKRTMYFASYTDEKLNVQIGDQGFNNAVGIPMFGRGLIGSYRYHPQHNTGAFALTSRPLAERPTSNSFGVFHDYAPYDHLTLKGFVARSEQYRRSLSSDIAGLQSAFRIDKHSIMISTSGTRRIDYSDPNAPVETLGHLNRIHYSSKFIDDKLNVRLTAWHNNRGFGLFDQERTFGMGDLSYQLPNGTNLRYQTFYNRVQRFNGTSGIAFQENHNNQLFWGIPSPVGYFLPFGFYNTSNMFNTRIHYRGLGFMYNQFNYQKNIRLSTNIRGGYNKAIDHPELKNYFSAQLFSLVQYRVFSLNMRYFYGPTSNIDQLFLTDKRRNPQILFLSLRHQYLFKNERFLLEQALNYSHHSHLRSHNIGYFPQLFYYSLTGWRFRAMAGYNLSVKNTNRYMQEVYDIQPPDGDLSTTVFQGFILNVGVRKEFGIPLPRTKKDYHDVKFIAFMDHNGNGEYEPDEDPVPNVVISFHNKERYTRDEVQTSDLGEAGFINLKADVYDMEIIPLEKIKGWFVNVGKTYSCEQSETVYLPFVRGTKLSGSVFVDRDKMSVTADQDLDLSRIRISAFLNGHKYHTLTDADGNYEFYLPNGTYTLSMNESVLGNKYTLAQNDFEVVLDKSSEGLFVPFFIIEKRKQVRKKIFGGEKPRIRIEQSGESGQIGGDDQSETKTMEPDTVTKENPDPIIIMEGDQDDDDGQEELQPDTIPEDGSDENKETEPDDRMNEAPLDDRIEYRDNEITEPYEPELVNFRVQLGIFREGDSVPSEVASKLIAAGYVHTARDDDGLVRFTSGNFDTYDGARVKMQELMNEGFEYLIVIGVYDDKIITSSLAREITGE